MAEKKNELETAFTRHYQEFERKLRPMQRTEFHCCIRCTEDPSLSAQEYNECLQKCKAPLNSLSDTMQTEVNKFQERYMRCARDCEDKIRDQLTPDMKELPPHLENVLNECSSKCSQEHVALVPQLFQKLDQYAQHYASQQK